MTNLLKAYRVYRMEITPLTKELLPSAADLFVQSFQEQRLATPALPDRMEHPHEVIKKLEILLTRGTGLAALEDGRLAGFLGWLLVDNFRNTPRRGAYSPEWGHAALPGSKQGIYRALYRAVAQEWARAGSSVHAISLLASDREAVQAWFWNGFGLTVVDAVRPLQPFLSPSDSGLEIRRAGPEDVELIAALDAEHWQHYTRPPIFMVPQPSLDPAKAAEFLARPKNSLWLALDGSETAGFMRFDGYEVDGVEVIRSETGVFISGAYVRPQYRGRGVAASILDAALRYYDLQGLRFCSLNFESFNPEAASFWMRYFQPVCLSLTRIPEVSSRFSP